MGGTQQKSCIQHDGQYRAKHRHWQQMMDKTDSLNCESISPIEVEDRQDAIMNRDFRTGLGQTIYIEEDQGTYKIIEVGQDMILIIGVITETI